MQIITLDFETYFDDEYTLKKMTTEEYIRDPRFEAHGAGIRWPDGRKEWLSSTCLKEQCESWSSEQSQIALLCHHAHFDGLISSHHFGYCPTLWLDTLSMGRVCFDGTISLALDSLATRFGFPSKSVPYQEFKGKHWHEMSPDLQRRLADGCLHDCELTWQCAAAMLSGGSEIVRYAFPASEIPVVDLTVRMFTEPVLVGDLEALNQAWTAEQEARDELFSRLGDVTPAMLRKDDVLAQMLLELGVEPPLKITTKGNEKYAFAKSDWAMQDLVMSENQDVALLAEARLKAQSSIYQTRCERLGWKARRGPLPVYLSYAAAHTRRWGGGDKDNWQNFPRSDPAKPQKGALRRAIKAP
jgi:DNA polymerase